MQKLLVVVDYQNDFVDGALGFKTAKDLEKPICDKIKEYLDNEYKVIFTYDTHFENYLNTREGKNLPIKHCEINTFGHELYGDLKRFINNKNVINYNKESFGISPEGMLKIYKEIGEVDTIEIVGVVTNMCVISNVIMFQAQYTDADIIIDAKLCASFDDELHEKALDVAESLQVKVINRK